MSPTCTGSRNVISSIATVTASPAAWRIAARPAAVSTSRITTPPCTWPAMFASVTSISWVRVTCESATRLGVRSQVMGRILRRASWAGR